MTFGTPTSPGVTSGNAQDTLVARYNDLEHVRSLMEANRGQVACIIVEPAAGNMGCVPPEPGVLEGLRTRCDEHGTVLICDEVMNGVRTAGGVAQEGFAITLS